MPVDTTSWAYRVVHLGIRYLKSPMRLSVFAIFLIQLIFYTLVWLWDQYVASYICIILPVVTGAVLLISWIADLIEPARIGRKYYAIMAISIIAPILTSVFFYAIYDGDLAWFKGI